MARKAQIYKLPYKVGIQVCSNHGPRGPDGVTIGKNIFTCVYVGKIFPKIFFSRTTAKKAEIYMKDFRHSTKVFIKIMVTGGSGGATIGETLYVLI
jgi:hypothetical protein